VKLTYVYYKNDSINDRIRARLVAKGKQLTKPTSDLTGTYICEDSKATVAAIVRQV